MTKMAKRALGTALAALISAPAIAGEAVSYKAAGADYEGYYAKAEGDSKGLVLVVHDWDGLTDYEKKRADMLADLGYDAFALDLYGAGNRPETTDAKKAETAKLYEDREAMRTRLMAGLDEARKKSGDEKAIVIGYCFGGAAVLEMARSGNAKDIAGYATFHGGLETPKGESYPDKTPPILIAQGGADESVPVDDAFALAKTLESKGITYTLEVYSGAPHAFTVFGSDRYRKVADEESWSAFKDFLNRYMPSKS
ncbi:dienelactone hydrolase family protein [Jiella sp. MQZ9-1]|uniref:Dienelactone hydrolase family protein n=1 Tax=Jiella flava TaxID=2816857 RepID=A0A939JTA0_9HYPH|nr:dienelactone hydrolase family protein [Jiella flava]MBO0663768.1 dienelactone hydrolase family protein [Jiella flava]MCD2472341.1 dienelactone hydrolase family protein [Jiella flava]